MIVGLYYTNWAIYKNHFLTDIDMSSVNHIFYCFMKIDPKSGAVSLSDPWADEQIPVEYKGQKFSGHIALLAAVKKLHPHLRIFFSIGGWSYKDMFREAISTRQKIGNFVRTTTELVAKYGFDGVDIDYEYPESDIDGGNFAILINELRCALPQKGLSLAIPAMPENYKYIRFSAIDASVDFYNVMTYDFAGSWSSVANLHCNLQPTKTSVWSVSQSIAGLSRVVKPSKLVVGMPMYGKYFEGCLRPQAPFTSCKDVLYKDISSNLKGFISYDTPADAKQKGKYVRKSNLAGGFWWESSGDRKDASLVSAFVAGL